MDQLSIENKPSSAVNAYIATCTANLAACACGCATAWTSPTIPKLLNPGEKILITVSQGAWLGSLLPLGACFGPLVTATIVSKLGRKWTILWNMVVFLVTWSIIGFANSIESMYAARFIMGISTGSVFNVVPVFVAEISPADRRGSLVSMMVLFLYAGCFLQYVVGPYFSFTTLVVVSACVPLLCALTFFWIPETPHYLLQNGRKREAFEALLWLRGHPNKDIVRNEISELQEEIDKSLNNEHQKSTPILKLFTSYGNLKSLYFALCVIAAQQLSGCNPVIFYSESIFQVAGAGLSSSVSTIILGAVMLFTGFFVPSLPKFTRIKNLLYISTIGAGLSLALLGLFFYLKDNHHDISSISWLPITSMIGFIVFHSSALGSYTWSIVSEIFSSDFRTIGTALATSFCWLLCFLLTLFFPMLSVVIGTAYTFWLLSTFCLVALIFFIFQLPDTEGKTFAEIQHMISAKNKGRYKLQNAKADRC